MAKNGATTDVIVINGGSSSGKSTLVAYLQKTLPGLWMALGIDTFIGSLPAVMPGGTGGIEFHDSGRIGIGADFTRLETAWMHGVAAMAHAGAKIIVDDGFLSGPPAQQRWRDALTGLEVVWVGVHCAPAVAAAREALRGDRHRGMAEDQALTVHQGISYDVELDTTDASPAIAAQPLVDYLRDRNDDH